MLPIAKALKPKTDPGVPGDCFIVAIKRTGHIGTQEKRRFLSKMQIAVVGRETGKDSDYASSGGSEDEDDDLDEADQVHV